jgi:phosphoribosylformylglycinamidine synthase
VLRYQGTVVGDIDLKFLHSGWSQQARIARPARSHFAEPGMREKRDYSDDLLQLLGTLNIASKEWVIRQYDHEVQGNSVVKPLVGKNEAGPSDGCVIRPRPDSAAGVVVACGLNPRFGLIDPGRMAGAAIDEALRNVTACGGDPDRTALLDNFCWGNPERPHQLAGFVQAAQACYRFAKGFRTPFISGKDSFYNEFQAEDGRQHPIPPTLLISAVAHIPDTARAVTMDLKQPSSRLWVLGPTLDELGGSEYYARHDALGSRVPDVSARTARDRMLRLHRAIRAGLVLACHDCSEGGLAVGLAEMCLAGGLGAELHLDMLPLGEPIPRIDHMLFSESNSRFIVEVARSAEGRFARIMGRTAVRVCGRVLTGPRITFRNKDRVVAELTVAEAERTWRSGLTRHL